MAPDLEALLTKFQALREPGPSEYAWAHHHPATRGTDHVVFSLMIHGDEYGTLPAGLALIEGLKDGSIQTDGAVTIVLGNPEAAREERRFLDFDLNRAWAFVPGAEGHEHRRAAELRSIYDSATLLLDMHQTILDSESSFWIFPWDPVFGRWARVLCSAPVGLTRSPGQAFAAEGLKCVDEYVRERGVPGFCIEFGRKGFDPEQADNAFRTMKKMLAVNDRIGRGETTLQAEADRAPAIRWYTTVHQEPWGDSSRVLRPGLKNWSPVEGGADLAAPGSPPIVPSCDGVVLFPKYPPEGEVRPSHQFHLAVPLTVPPDQAFAPPETP